MNPRARHVRTARFHRVVAGLRELCGLSIQELIAGCSAWGLPMDDQEYREIEAGTRLPENPAAFVQAFSACLSLSPQEQLALLCELAFAVLCEELGEELATHVFVE